PITAAATEPLMYSWLVFLHVAGAFAFVLAHGVAANMTLRLRTERDPERVRALLGQSSGMIGLTYSTLVALLIFGELAAFAGDLWGRLWVWLALGLLLGIIVFMYAVALPYYNHVRHAVGLPTYRDKPGAPLPEPLPPAELAALLASPRPVVIVVVGW